MNMDKSGQELIALVGYSAMVDEGGISNGETIRMRIAFKPTSTIGEKQQTVTRDRKETELIAHGHHDPCVVPRAVLMVEAVVALVLVDQLMAQYAQCQLFPPDSTRCGPARTLALPNPRTSTASYLKGGKWAHDVPW